LLGGGSGTNGVFEIKLLDLAHAKQFYWRNSAVLETRLHDRAGGAIAIVDFAPRFMQHGRAFRPIMLIRRIRPIAGTPRVRIQIRPRHDFGAGEPEVTRGSNHIRFVSPETTLRLTTDAPVSCILEEVPFVLSGPLELILGPDETLPHALSDIARQFAERTDAYWRDWCRGLSLPFEWQDAVIRAAITLKLMSFEDTGAIVAAMTTSIPEAPCSGRTWDYRYCWLRDAYFVVNALNRLNATRTMEGYLDYIVNIVSSTGDNRLQPLYSILHETDLTERQVSTLPGYRGMGPIRTGNDAVTQVQNDGYGSVILACAQSFFDKRLDRPGDEALFWRLEKLGEKAAARWNQADSSLWEYRQRNDVHTHSSVLCWAACDRLALIAGALGLGARQSHWRQRADQIREAILAQAWNEQLDSFVSTFGGSTIDASLLLLPNLGIIDPQDLRFRSTLQRIERELRHGRYLYRYVADEMGPSSTAFIVCSFWYVEALAAVGRTEEARELFEHLLARRNHVGLLSEDLDVESGELWGNFPQTYSMVGLIHAAMDLSRRWEKAF
jgi:GH15 family glucan-1,4-alpha-glucosidase